MSWIAVIGGVISFAIELLKLIREVKNDKKERDVELKKRKTEIIQSGIRGLIDGDDRRYVTSLDQLRNIRKR